MCKNLQSHQHSDVAWVIGAPGIANLRPRKSWDASCLATRTSAHMQQRPPDLDP